MGVHRQAHARSGAPAVSWAKVVIANTLRKRQSFGARGWKKEGGRREGNYRRTLPINAQSAVFANN
jgi:hypothetical protein